MPMNEFFKRPSPASHDTFLVMEEAKEDSEEVEEEQKKPVPTSDSILSQITS